MGLLDPAPGSEYGTILERRLETLFEQAADSGSNSNGFWVRLGDGTQICWGRWTLSPSNSSDMSVVINGASATLRVYYVDYQWTFPQPFVSIPAVATAGMLTGASREISTYAAKLPTTTGVTLRVNTLSNWPAATISAVAVGGWK